MDPIYWVLNPFHLLVTMNIKVEGKKNKEKKNNEQKLF